MEKFLALISAAGLAAVVGACAISFIALSTYLGAGDGSPLSAKIAAAVSVHLLATVVMFVLAGVFATTVYLPLRRFGFANYLTTGAVGFAVGLFFAPTFAMALGGLVAGLIFHWRFDRFVNG